MHWCLFTQMHLPKSTQLESVSLKLYSGVAFIAIGPIKLKLSKAHDTPTKWQSLLVLVQMKQNI